MAGAFPPVPPGATIGILGGGQLGRMLAIAAAQLGYRCHVYAPPDEDCVAAAVSAKHTLAAWQDEAAMARFAADCDVVTYEFENVPVAPLAALGTVPLRAPARALEIAQDRLAEKRFVADLGGRSARYAPIQDAEALQDALREIGTPGIVKTRREGYDGKGQWRIAQAGQASAIDLPDRPLIYEGLVRFSAEFSVILVRGGDGEIRFWDSAVNEHEGGMLRRSTVPAGPELDRQVEAARALAAKVAAALDYIGVLTLEFFATEEGPLFNEMAPRVHNSGHWTIEGAVTSQFENHIRAICRLPLGDTALLAPRVEMRNIIGEQAGGWATMLARPGCHLHLYGKREARAGRKMGHVTLLQT